MPRRKKRSSSQPSGVPAPASDLSVIPDPEANKSPATDSNLAESSAGAEPAPVSPGVGIRIIRKHSPPRLALMVLAPLVLLAILFLQLFFGVRDKSATLDEQNHIARGLAYLRTGDPRLSLIHPPLVNLICALPLRADKAINLPLDDISWKTSDYNSFARQLLWMRNDNGPSMVARARVPIMILTVLLGALVFIWAAELYGWTAGMLALGLFCFDPNVLAHGALATNDLGMACFTCLALYVFWRLLMKPGWRTATLAGVALGLALTAKFSSIFLFLALPAMALIDWALSARSQRTIENLKRLSILAIVVIGVAGFTVWAVYGFQIHYDTIRGFPIPAKTYFDGLQVAKARIEGGGPEFLLGGYSTEGWWYYFPVAFLVKTPIPTMILAAAALAFAIKKREWRQTAVLLSPVIIYFGLAMNSPLEIGYRHLLPILPVLFVFTGQIANWRPPRFAWIRWAVPLLMVWLVFDAARIYPDYLTFFNEAAGGPRGGARILADSNLDWGQDLPGLRKYMQAQGLDSINLSYFGSARLEAYGITNFEPLPSYPYIYRAAETKVGELSHPPPGVYAISINNLLGVFFKDRNLYGWFRSRKPDAVIGNSIAVYRVK